MGRSNMSSLKITLLPLAICLLLSLNSQVFGKPSPKHLLIETKEKAKKRSDYDYANIGSNSGVVNDHSRGNFKGRDYANIGSNSGVVNDHSQGNFKGRDYANIGSNSGVVNDWSVGNFAGKK